MKKKLFITLFIFTLSIANFFILAEETVSVNFLNLNFQEAMDQAKKENKYLFIDCYTTWCGPCRMMEKEVFSQKMVGDYFNKQFVCIKIDMEKPEGKELRKLYIVNAYPTFLFIDNQGNQIHKLVGSTSAEEFIKKVKSGMEGNNVNVFAKRFEKGEKGDAFLEEYYQILCEANMVEESRKVAEIYLENKTEKILTDETAFKMFSQSIHSPYNSCFIYFWKNKDAFAEKYTAETVERLATQVWCGYGNELINKEGFKQSQLDDYAKEMKKEGVSEYKRFRDINYMYYYQKNSLWNDFVDLMGKYTNNKKYHNGELDLLLYNWSLSFERKCSDKTLRAKAANIIEKRKIELDKQAEKERKEKEKMPKGTVFAMSMINFSQSYDSTIKKLRE